MDSIFSKKISILQTPQIAISGAQAPHRAGFCLLNKQKREESRGFVRILRFESPAMSTAAHNNLLPLGTLARHPPPRDPLMAGRFFKTPEIGRFVS